MAGGADRVAPRVVISPTRSTLSSVMPMESEVLLPTATRRADGPWATLRQGWALFSTRRRGWLALTHLALGVVLVLYFLMVLANSAGFAYSFWNEPPPNAAADRFAVLSLLALAISVLSVGHLVFGAYCVMFLDARLGRRSSLASVLRRSVGPALRAWWWGGPLFLVGAIAVVMVAPVLVTLPVFVAAPFSVFLAATPSMPGYPAFLDALFPRFWVVNVIVAGGGLVVGQSVVWSGLLVERYDGLLELLVLPLSWACYLILACSAALSAACAAVVVPADLAASSTEPGCRS